jgi:hypothetical protein
VVGDGERVGPGGGERLTGRVGGEPAGLLLDLRDLVGRKHLAAHQRVGEQLERVVAGFGGELFDRTVLALGVGRGVGEGAGDLGVEEADAAPGAHPVDRGRARLANGEVVAPVDAEHLEPWESRHQPANGTRRLVAAGNRDRPAVVGDDEQERHLQRAGAAQRLPELALRAGAFAERHIRDLVAAAGAPGESLVVAQVPGGLRAAERRQGLRAGRAGLRHDVAVGGAPVRRHLAAARRRVGRRAHRLQQDVVGRYP